MGNPVKILIAEHDIFDIELIQHELNKGGMQFIAEIVGNETEYIASIHRFDPDIILSDYTFPGFTGLAAFAIAQRLVPFTPFVFVSGTIGEEKSIELIKTGVTDYVLKDSLHTLYPKTVRALLEATTEAERKKNEQELTQSEKSLNKAQQVSRIGSWEFNFKKNLVRLSGEACRIYGLPSHQNLQPAESWLAFIHPEDAGLVLDKIKESGDHLLDFSTHYRITNSNGSVRHIYSEGKLEFDSDGKPEGLYGIVHDVTETRLLEDQAVQDRYTRQSEITLAVLTAHENERAAIGKELHEDMSQVLCLAKIKIELAKTDTENRGLLLDTSMGHVTNVIKQIRKMAKMLRRPDTTIALFDSIHDLVEDLAAIHPIELEFDAENMDESILSDKLQLTIFRIVQEQLNNIIQHSRATHVTITLSKLEQEVELTISDNGMGVIMPKEIAGVGIKNIRSRADLYDGTVTIESQPGMGYKLRVALSLSEHRQKSKAAAAFM